MKGVFFDTSALVPVLTEQLSNHLTAHARFVSELGSGKPIYCSAHNLAECYATLTALPLPRKISAAEAAKLIEVNFRKNLRIVELTSADYFEAIDLCATRGRVSGQVYDALHLVAALKVDCEHIYSYNVVHFASLAGDRLTISAP